MINLTFTFSRLAAILAGLLAVTAVYFLLQPDRVTHNSPVSITGLTMGTSFEVQFFSSPDTASSAKLQQEINALLNRLDRQLFSIYVPDSEISRFNQIPVATAFPVSSEFIDLFAKALYVHDISEGAFDLTMAPLVNLWGFGATEQNNLPPSETKIMQALRSTGMEKVVVESDSSTLKKTLPVQLDMGGIAKGFAAQELARLLDKYGIRNYLVEIGGELVSKGRNIAADRPWQLAIEAPDSSKRKALQLLTLPAQKWAIATSGSYRNYFERGGRQFSHEIDPRNGWPVEHNLVSATVLHEEGAVADALATAMMVMGYEKSVALAKKEKLAIFLVREANGEFLTYSSKKMQEFGKQ